MPNRRNAKETCASPNCCNHACGSIGLAARAAASRPAVAVGLSPEGLIDRFGNKAGRKNQKAKFQAQEQFWMDFEVRYRVIDQLFKMTRYNCMLMEEVLDNLSHFVEKLSPKFCDAYVTATAAIREFWILSKDMDFKDFEACLNETYSVLKKRFGRLRGRRHNPTKHTSLSEHLVGQEMLTRSEKVLMGWKDKAVTLDALFEQITVLQVAVVHAVIFIDKEFDKDMVSQFLEYKTVAISVAYRKCNVPGSVVSPPIETSCATLKGWMFRNEDELTIYGIRYWDRNLKQPTDKILEKKTEKTTKKKGTNEELAENNVPFKLDLDIETSKPKNQRRKRAGSEMSESSKCSRKRNNSLATGDEDFELGLDSMIFAGTTNIHSKEEVKIRKQERLKGDSNNKQQRYSTYPMKDTASTEAEQHLQFSDDPSPKRSKKIVSRSKTTKNIIEAEYKVLAKKHAIAEKPSEQYRKSISRSQGKNSVRKNLRLQSLCLRKRQAIIRAKKLRTLSVFIFLRSLKRTNTKTISYSANFCLDDEDSEWESLTELTEKPSKAHNTDNLNNSEKSNMPPGQTAEVPGSYQCCKTLDVKLPSVVCKEIKTSSSDAGNIKPLKTSSSKVGNGKPTKPFKSSSSNVSKPTKPLKTSSSDVSKPLNYGEEREALLTTYKSYDRIVKSLSEMVLKYRIPFVIKALNKEEAGLLNDLFVNLKKLNVKEYDRIMAKFLVNENLDSVVPELNSAIMYGGIPDPEHKFLELAMTIHCSDKCKCCP